MDQEDLPAGSPQPRPHTQDERIADKPAQPQPAAAEANILSHRVASITPPTLTNTSPSLATPNIPTATASPIATPVSVVTAPVVIPTQVAPQAVVSSDIVVPEVSVPSPPIISQSSPSVVSGAVEPVASDPVNASYNSAAADQTEEKDKKVIAIPFSFSLGSLLSGILSMILYTVLLTNYSSSHGVIGYWLLFVVSALGFSLLSIPSFKKSAYPNVVGLIGLLLNFSVLINCVLLLATYYRTIL